MSRTSQQLPVVSWPAACPTPLAPGRVVFRKVASGPLARSSYHARDMADDASARQ
ncbi:MAG: hypothetical protein ACK54F_14125 [Planctomycetia bacterium]